MHRPTLTVFTQHGHPCVDVPVNWLWDLAEYLAMQRLTVTYHFADTHFEVEFPKSDAATIQTVLQDWEHGAESEVQHA